MRLVAWGPKVVALRAQTGLSQSQLAGLLDVTQATISRWESGRQSPTGPQQTKLRQLMNNAPAGQSAAGFIAHSPFSIVLLSREWTVLAMSVELAGRNGSAMATIRGLSLKENATAEMERSFATLSERSFFSGAPTAYRIVGRGIYASGQPNIFDAVVSPIAIDGQIAALCQTRPLDEQSYAELRQVHDLISPLDGPPK